MAYITSEIIRSFAEAEDASTPEVWNILAASASMIFDRACGVSDNFFAKAGDLATEKKFFLDETGFLKLLPYVPESITEVKSSIAGTEYLFSSTGYFENDGFLIFPTSSIYYPLFANSRTPISVFAKWGFSDVPADVKQAVIEQAIFMWRRKDAAFTEISGVSTAVVQQQLAPTCQFVADKYKGKYLDLSV